MKLRRLSTVSYRNMHEKLFMDQLQQLFNGNISFGTGINTQDKNIQGAMVEITDSGGANSSIVINHNLGYIPKFYDIKYLSASTIIYDFGTTWTKTQVFLASTAANIKFRVFIH
jgi:hypothetical protein